MSSRYKQKILYHNLRSAQRPIQHNNMHPVPKFLPDNNFSDMMKNNDSEGISMKGDEIFNFVDCNSPLLFNQPELNDLSRDLKLSILQSELLGSQLKQKNVLQNGCHTTFRHRSDRFKSYFSMEDDLCFAKTLMDCTQQNPQSRRLAIVY
jgi:hypothetical protein